LVVIRDDSAQAQRTHRPHTALAHSDGLRLLVDLPRDGLQQRLAAPDPPGGIVQASGMILQSLAQIRPLELKSD
jgi:hypothetical protein